MMLDFGPGDRENVITCMTSGQLANDYTTIKESGEPQRGEPNTWQGGENE
jgi:hypothetical protein